MVDPDPLDRILLIILVGTRRRLLVVVAPSRLLLRLARLLAVAAIQALPFVCHRPMVATPDESRQGSLLAAARMMGSRQELLRAWLLAVVQNNRRVPLQNIRGRLLLGNKKQPPHLEFPYQNRTQNPLSQVLTLNMIRGKTL